MGVDGNEQAVSLIKGDTNLKATVAQNFQGMAGFSGWEATDFDALGVLLNQSVPGSGGTLFLPYLVGERFPVLDPDARGCYIGLTPRTTSADLVRAALEGVAFSIRQGLELLDAAPQSVSLIGGGGREAVWCQILADVLGREIAVFRDAELLPAITVASAALLGLGKISWVLKIVKSTAPGPNLRWTPSALLPKPFS